MIKIVDFSRVLAGPYATMLLADLGAEVIKVERPVSGDDTRSWGPPYAPDGTSTYFASVNRNKTSVSIDLELSSGRTEALKLIETADVVVENFAPGTMAKFGLDYATLSQLKPDLVYCSISGFGNHPNALAMPGYDLLVQAVGGLMSITGEPDAGPTKVGVAVVDVITGLHAVVGIQRALLHRIETGQGQLVEVNLLSSLLSGLVNQANSWVTGGVLPERLGNAHPSIVPYQTFQTSDQELVIAVGNDKQFQAFALVLGHAEWAADSRFADNASRVQHRTALQELISQVLVTKPAAEWESALLKVRVPCGRINNIAQAFELAEQLGLDPIVEIDQLKLVANPIKFSKTPVTYRSRPPKLAN